MKKRFILLITALVCLALGLTLVACNDGEGGGGDGGKGTAYSIQAPAASDVYTVEGLPESACEGDTVKFRITLTDPENSIIDSVSVDYDEIEEGADGYYSFTMPAEPVKVEVEARAFSEVLTDGGVAFSADNPTEITVNGDNGGGYWTEDSKWIDCWKFDITVDLGYTTALADSSYAVSSNQNVIPDNAIKLTAENDYSSGLLKNVEILIDSSKINPGKTWLEIHLQSDNVSSNRGTVCVQITVTPDGTIVETEKWTENIVFNVSQLDDERRNFDITVFDKDYSSNTDAKEHQEFSADDMEIVDNKITITIEYVPGHRYGISLIYHGSGYTPKLGETVTPSAQYDDGDLIFKADGAEISIIVT